jgi:hypothetical protein
MRDIVLTRGRRVALGVSREGEELGRLKVEVDALALPVAHAHVGRLDLDRVEFGEAGMVL